jgi:hypothetical protein
VAIRSTAGGVLLAVKIQRSQVAQPDIPRLSHAIEAYSTAIRLDPSELAASTPEPAASTPEYSFSTVKQSSEGNQSPAIIERGKFGTLYGAPGPNTLPAIIGGAVPKPAPTEAPPVPKVGILDDTGREILRDPFADVQKAAEALVQGHVAFNTPEKMRMAKTQQIQVVLGVSPTVSDLMSKITSPGKKEISSLKVGPNMTATLIGGGAFDISPSGPQSEFVTEESIASWTFAVTPKLTGPQELTLTIDATINVNGKDGPIRVNTLTRRIMVEVGWPETPAEWFEAGKTWFENLSWLWISILLPIGGIVVARWRKKSPDTSESQALEATLD